MKRFWDAISCRYSWTTVMELYGPEAVPCLMITWINGCSCFFPTFSGIFLGPATTECWFDCCRGGPGARRMWARGCGLPAPCFFFAPKSRPVVESPWSKRQMKHEKRRPVNIFWDYGREISTHCIDTAGGNHGLIVYGSQYYATRFVSENGGFTSKTAQSDHFASRR